MKTDFKKAMFCLMLVVFAGVNYAQEIELTDNITFEVEKIKYKRVTRGGKGWVIAPEGHKYIVIDVNFYGKSGKREKLPLFEMTFETDEKKYEVRPFPDVDADYVKGFYHKVRKRKNRDLYVVVKKGFETGVLSFKGKKILKISVEKGAKKGTFELIK